jgi:hypothetical protein
VTVAYGSPAAALTFFERRAVADAKKYLRWVRLSNAA